MEWQLGAAVEFALEDLRREPDRRVLLEAIAQLGDTRRGKREADSMRVAAETDEDIVAALERFQQMEAGDGAAGAVGLAIFVTEYERGTTGALDYTRGEDAEHAAMPALAVDDEAAELIDRTRCQHGVDLGKNRGLGGATFGVELIKLHCQLACAVGVTCGEELDDIGSDIHAAGGVDARADAKADVGCCQTALRRIQLGNREQRAQSWIDGTAQFRDAEAGDNAVLTQQWYRVGDSREHQHLEE